MSDAAADYREATKAAVLQQQSEELAAELRAFLRRNRQCERCLRRLQFFGKGEVRVCRACEDN